MNLRTSSSNGRKSRITTTPKAIETIRTGSREAGAPPPDEALFEHYTTTQLAMIGLDGTVRKIGEPGIFAGFSTSPNGEHLLVTEIRRPFSYLMTYRSFPQASQVWNARSGAVEHTVAIGVFLPTVRGERAVIGAVVLALILLLLVVFFMLKR